ncbi:4-hydroxybenzoate 3-monooxygenase [Granulicella sp. S156]|jgi:p-hydroxybenzoate 3-monooxygenase|uniref:4-hydroxybenzoate 3-monooxygenase n=1 Tax=Granulicella sp. S156 TaxID=1747224 RepID=UPI00131CDBA4|nr:4-hydroxybenzoate 3-monooxygenase [Granulicella sp. S156]
MTANECSPKQNQETKVAIVGGGVAGLTLAIFLQRSGVACVLLERRNRAHVEARQRAGFIEADAVAMYERWGVADKLPEGPVARGFEIRINGSGRVFERPGEEGSQGRFCTQQQLVTNLLRELIDEMRGDVRFEVTDIAIQNDEDGRPRVSYCDASGPRELVCDYIAGCDGGHSVSRSSIPHGVLTKYNYEFGYAWLAALVEAPVTGLSVMGVSDHGFAAQIPRGPSRSRIYLQCAVSDGLEDWPEERIWDEMRLRLCDDTIQNAVILDKDVIPLRSVVYTPVQYRNLFLAGDAAHLVPPTGAKGMNLALRDVDVLAKALVSAARDGDRNALENYSDTVLPHIWKEQEFSASMTDTFHDAGDPSQRGTFRQGIARARLDAFFAS